jgi:mRNA-degrading endonuclease RelE of RelBE toxin-antitoxin system
MEVIFSENAEKELDDIDSQLRTLFLKHAEKIKHMPPRRHLRFGLPYNVEDVTKQARLVYYIEEEKLYVLHCFKNHKEYERWYKSFK